MVYYILDIIPKIQAFSRKLDEISLLADRHWVVIGEVDVLKTVYMFRKSGQLLISTNGIIEWGSWEYLGNNAIIISRDSKSYLFKNGFLDDSVLALRLDGTETYALLVNETQYGKDINKENDVIEFLESKYVRSPQRSSDSGNIAGNSPTVLGREQLTDQRVLTFIAINNLQKSIIKGCKVLLNGSSAPNGRYLTLSGQIFDVYDGFLQQIFTSKSFTQADGSIQTLATKSFTQTDGTIIDVEYHSVTGIEEDCRVFLNGQAAPDGIYKAGFLSWIRVKNGRVG